MNIIDLLPEDGIDLNATASSKKEAIEKACLLMQKTGAISNLSAYEKAVLAREKESTTGVGDGIAIPHAKGDFVKSPGLIAIRFKEGVDYDSLDKEPVHLLFLIAAPNNKENTHLDILARLSKLLLDEDMVSHLEKANSKHEFRSILDQAEKAKFSKGPEQKVASSYDIVAVTACPTGIAHTYMAEEALRDEAAKKNLSIKVETNGQGGVKNLLTDNDIANARGIVIAADIGVPMDRFNGRRLVNIPVSEAIHEPGKAIDEALSGTASVYHAVASADSSTSSEEGETGKGGGWHAIYKHLMNGVSHMLPFVIGGGILIAIAFLIDGASGNSGVGSTFGTTNPVAAWCKTLGGYAFNLMLPILAAFIAYSIADRPAFVPGFVGGLLASSTSFSIGYVITYGSVTATDTNGSFVSTAGFIGALIAGFAAGYFVLLLRKAFRWMPKSLESMKPMLIYPLLGTVMIGIFMFLMNTPFTYINIGFSWILQKMNSLNLTILLGIILATMMATDMGGPINKASYLFGVGLLTDAVTNPGNAVVDYELMACVMIGGMVPPLAIALATNLFPLKWSKKERNDGRVNYLMGLSFITEGAIPYAATYPLPVILSSMIGSAVAGALSVLFGCELMAPHGGIFVFPVVINWYWYLLALVVGSFVGACMLGVTMKNNPNPEWNHKWKGLYNVHTGLKEDSRA